MTVFSKSVAAFKKNCWGVGGLVFHTKLFLVLAAVQIARHEIS